MGGWFGAGLASFASGITCSRLPLIGRPGPGGLSLRDRLVWRRIRFVRLRHHLLPAAGDQPCRYSPAGECVSRRSGAGPASFASGIARFWLSVGWSFRFRLGSRDVAGWCGAGFASLRSLPAAADQPSSSTGSASTVGVAPGPHRSPPASLAPGCRLSAVQALIDGECVTGCCSRRARIAALAPDSSSQVVQILTTTHLLYRSAAGHQPPTFPTAGPTTSTA